MPIEWDGFVSAFIVQIIEVNLAQAMRNAGELHNARVSRRQQRKQSARQREVGQIVCAEMQLEPVRRHLAFRRSHDARVVDQNVYRSTCGEQAIGASSEERLRGTECVSTDSIGW